MDAEYAKWRDDAVKTVGGKVQREAEALLDNQAQMRHVEVVDDKSGAIKSYREDVAAAKVRKGHASYRVLYSAPPSEAYRQGWERIWGNG